MTQHQNPQSSLEELAKAIDTIIDRRLDELLPNNAAYIPYINLITPKELMILIDDNREKILFALSTEPLFQYLINSDWFRRAVRNKIVANIRGGVIYEIINIDGETIAKSVALLLNETLKSYPSPIS